MEEKKAKKEVKISVYKDGKLTSEEMTNKYISVSLDSSEEDFQTGVNVFRCVWGASTRDVVRLYIGLKRAMKRLEELVPGVEILSYAEEALSDFISSDFQLKKECEEVRHE